MFPGLPSLVAIHLFVLPLFVFLIFPRKPDSEVCTSHLSLCKLESAITVPEGEGARSGCNWWQCIYRIIPQPIEISLLLTVAVRSLKRFPQNPYLMFE